MNESTSDKPSSEEIDERSNESTSDKLGSEKIDERPNESASDIPNSEKIDERPSESASDKPISEKIDERPTESASDKPNSEKFDERPSESHFSNDLSSNSSTKRNSIATLISKVVICLLLLGCVTLFSVKIFRKEVEEKDWHLNSNVIFSFITALDDEKWAHHAMVHLWANEYGIEEKQKKSSEILQSKLAASNVWVAFHLAKFTGDKDLQNATEVFLLKNVEKTVLDPIWVKRVISKILQAAKYFKTEF